MPGRLLGPDQALIDEHLHVRVVLGQLVEPAVAQQVGPGVADVGQRRPVTGEDHRGEGRAHALQRRVAQDGLGDPPVGHLEGLVQRVHLMLVVDRHVERGHGVDREAAGDVAGRHPAHAVGHHEKSLARVERVLIVAPDAALIGDGGPPKVQGHGGSLPGHVHRVSSR